MFGLFALLVIAVVSLSFVGFHRWARQVGAPAAGQAMTEPQGKRGQRGISLITEAVGYVGAVLILAGGVAAISQQWHSFTDWERVSVCAASAVFFLLAGVLVRRVREPAIERLVGVVWFLSVVAVASAAGIMAHDVFGNSVRATVLAVGTAASLYSAVLWLVRRGALQSIALFAALVVTVCGVIVVVAGDPAPSLAFAFALWGLGIAWAVLGQQRYIEPLWVTLPLGALLALLAPSLAAGEHGWVFAIAIATAAAAMAISVPLRNTPLLALGTLAMFGYVTSTVIRYFGASLGVPAALAITGVLIVGLAVVSAHLMRSARSPKPAEPAGEIPAHYDLPKAS